jgi:hypothetical protein
VGLGSTHYQSASKEEHSDRSSRLPCSGLVLQADAVDSISGEDAQASEIIRKRSSGEGGDEQVDRVSDAYEQQSSANKMVELGSASYEGHSGRRRRRSGRCQKWAPGAKRPHNTKEEFQRRRRR